MGRVEQTKEKQKVERGTHDLGTMSHMRGTSVGWVRVWIEDDE